MTRSSPRPVSLRHEQGRAYIAALLDYWIKRSDISYDKLSRIADWGLGERGLLSPSQISHIRNNDLMRPVPTRNLEGMAGANLAIWLWNHKGEDQALRRLGPHSTWKVEPESLDSAIWLPTHDDDTEPLTYGDFAEISAGILTMPYLTLDAAAANGPGLSERLSKLLNALAGGGTPAEGVSRVLAAYPITEPDRQRRLRDLMLGDHWTAAEVEAELYALSLAVSHLRALPLGSYGPDDLRAELLSRNDWS